MRINVQVLIRDVTQDEGGKENLSIAQVGEVVSKTIKRLAKYSIWDIAMLIKRYRKER